MACSLSFRGGSLSSLEVATLGFEGLSDAEKKTVNLKRRHSITCASMDFVKLAEFLR